jgi:hypothetical protein
MSTEGLEPATSDSSSADLRNSPVCLRSAVEDPDTDPCASAPDLMTTEVLEPSTSDSSSTDLRNSPVYRRSAVEDPDTVP